MHEKNRLACEDGYWKFYANNTRSQSWNKITIDTVAMYVGEQQATQGITPVILVRGSTNRNATHQAEGWV